MNLCEVLTGFSGKTFLLRLVGRLTHVGDDLWEVAFGFGSGFFLGLVLVLFHWRCTYTNSIS